MKIRAKTLRSTRLGISGRSVDVDGNGFVIGLSEEEGRRLLTMPNEFEDTDPNPEPVEPEVEAAVADQKDEAKGDSPVAVRRGPGRPKKGG